MNRLLRVTTYVLRFVHNIKSRIIKKLKITGGEGGGGGGEGRKNYSQKAQRY